MFRTAVLLLAVLVSQAAQAADLRMHHRVHHHHARRVAGRIIERNNVIHCTTSNVVGLFSYSDCGQGFDPLSSASN